MVDSDLFAIAFEIGKGRVVDSQRTSHPGRIHKHKGVKPSVPVDGVYSQRYSFSLVHPAGLGLGLGLGGVQYRYTPD